MSRYFPDAKTWERISPTEVSADAEQLREAVEFAKENDSEYPYDFSRDQRRRRNADRLRSYSELEGGHGDEHEYHRTIGPLPDGRGGPAGVVVHEGRILAEWGDIQRVGLANSVTKSCLSAVGGIAFDEELINDVHERVGKSIHSGEFDYSHNELITWHHLLQQISEWEGALFGKPDLADRRAGRERSLEEPGTFWEYNNVRVNLLALCLLRIFEKPLPMIFKEKIMDPIGASGSWQWHGYHNSDVVINNYTGFQPFKSVTGGGQWGGGLWVNTLDLARLGYLYLNRGEWKGEQILSEAWNRMTTAPCDVKPTYGYLWWLNTNNRLWEDVPDTSFAAIGGGHNVIWVDPEHDLVVVLRWFQDKKTSKQAIEGRDQLPNQNEFYRQVIKAIE